MPTRHSRDTRVKRFTQRYIAYTVDGQHQRLPLLHIRLIGNTDSFTTMALVDSGATVNFVPPELAEAVGLQKLRENASAEGAGGTFMNDVYKFEVQLLRKSDVMYTLVGEAHVPKDEGRIPFVVLGREGIFDAYDITFRERKQCISLKPASGSSD